jgi:hypothetical protein
MDHGVATLRRYKLRQEALPAEQARARSTYIPAFIAIPVVVCIVSFAASLKSQSSLKTLVIYAAGFGAWFAYLAISMSRKTMQQLERCWKTYELEIGPDDLTRRQEGYPDLAIPLMDITKIQRVPGRYVQVHGTERDQVIGIPEALECFDDVVGFLSLHRPIEQRTTEAWKRTYAYTGIGMAAFFTMLWATSPAVVIPLAVVMIVLLPWLFWRTRTSKVIPQKTRLIAWVYLLFTITAIMKLLSVLGPYLPHPQS